MRMSFSSSREYSSGFTVEGQAAVNNSLSILTDGTVVRSVCSRSNPATSCCINTKQTNLRCSVMRSETDRRVGDLLLSWRGAPVARQTGARVLMR